MNDTDKHDLKPLTTTLGTPADGEERYFRRKKTEAKIWKTIGRGQDIFLASPRRVGKSSLLKHLERNPQQGYFVRYKAVQAIDSIDEYFKQIYRLLLEEDSIFSHYQRRFQQLKGALKRFASRIRGIGLEGVEIDSEDRTDYYEECRILLESLPEGFDTVVLLIDEFPDAVGNILEIAPREGVRFLQLIRDMRQEYGQVGIRFVYTGSTGLGNVVKRLGRLDLTGDIRRIPVPPLSREEARELIQRLVLGKRQDRPDFALETDVIDSIVDIDSWLIPYYIQMILEELFDSFPDSGGTIPPGSVTAIVDKIIRDRYSYQDFFENWKTRLKQAFEKREEYRCALDILNAIAIKGEMDRDSLIDCSVKHGIADAKTVTDILEYDGYIYKDRDSLYKFNSIILKEWWYVNVAT